MRKLYITLDDDQPWNFKIENNPLRAIGQNPNPLEDVVITKGEKIGDNCIVLLVDEPGARMPHLCYAAVELFASAKLYFDHQTPFQATQMDAWHIQYDQALEVPMKLIGGHDNPFSRQMASPMNLFIVHPYNDSRKNPLDWPPYDLGAYKWKTAPTPSTTSEDKGPPLNVPKNPIGFDEVKSWGFYIEITTGEIMHFKGGGN